MTSSSKNFVIGDIKGHKGVTSQSVGRCEESHVPHHETQSSWLVKAEAHDSFYCRSTLNQLGPLTQREQSPVEVWNLWLHQRWHVVIQDDRNQVLDSAE